MSDSGGGKGASGIGAWLSANWVIILGFLLSGLAGYTSLMVRLSSDEGDAKSNQQAILQAISTLQATEDQKILGIVQTISDMKANLLPKRVQSLEDSMQAMQQANASQFSAMQASIQSIQNANQQSNQTLQAGIHDIQTQMNALTNTVTTLQVQVQYGLSAPTDGGSTKHR